MTTIAGTALSSRDGASATGIVAAGSVGGALVGLSPGAAAGVLAAGSPRRWTLIQSATVPSGFTLVSGTSSFSAASALSTP